VVTSLRGPSRSDIAMLPSCGAGACLFGTAFVATDVLPATPLWNAVWRILPAGLLLFVIRPAMPRGGWWARSAVLGALNFGGFFAFQAVAAHRLPGAMVSTISAAQCVVVPVIVLMLGQRVSSRQLWMPVVGAFGVGLLVLQGDTGLDSVGVAASAALAMLSASGMVLTRRWGVPPSTHPLSAIAWQMLAGGIILAPLAVVIEGRPPAMTFGQLGTTAWLAGPATALAFALFFGGLFKGVAATTASRLLLLGPVVAALLGWVVAGDTLSVAQLVGIALVLAVQFGGTSAVNQRPARHARTPSACTRSPGTTARPGAWQRLSPAGFRPRSAV
jgi:probable blue pigment (indigoidine) exporter